MSDPRRSKRPQLLPSTNVGRSTSTALSLENGTLANKKRSTRFGESSVELANRHFHQFHTESTALPPSAATFTRSLPPKCAEPGTKNKCLYYIAMSTLEGEAANNNRSAIATSFGWENMVKTLRERMGFDRNLIGATLICKGYGKCEKYDLKFEAFLPSDFVKLFSGVTLGWQDNNAVTDYLAVYSSEAKEAQVELERQCTIYYLAEVDENDNYSYEDAYISLTVSNLKSMDATIQSREVFQGQVRKLNITFPDVHKGVLMQTGTSLDDHVWNYHTFPSLELAEEHQSSYDAKTGVLIGPEGDAWLARVQTQPVASYDLLKKGSNKVVNVTTSRGALEYMKGSGTNSKQRKEFDKWLEEQKLDMMKKKGGGGRGSKSHFVNPTMLPENGAVLKDKFGVDATYTIKGVISYD